MKIYEKLHHLVPKTYIAPWFDGDKKTIFLQAKERENKDDFEEINVESIAGLDYYHIISVGMPFATKEDTDVFFAPLNGLKVFYREKELTSTLEMNREFDFFEDWEIMREDGSHVKKKALKHEISQTKIDIIENGWYEHYEKKWNDTRKSLETLILNGDKGKLEENQKQYLLAMFMVFNWKSLSQIPLFSEILTLVPFMKQVEIPKRQAKRTYIKTPEDEWFQWLLLNLLRQFFEGYGAFCEITKELSEKVSLQFIIASENQRFVTSDNPCFYADEIGFFPLTPEILICIKPKKEDDFFDVILTKDEDMCKYNKIIVNNSNCFVIRQKDEL